MIAFTIFGINFSKELSKKIFGFFYHQKKDHILFIKKSLGHSSQTHSISFVIIEQQDKQILVFCRGLYVQNVQRRLLLQIMYRLRQFLRSHLGKF